MDADLTTLTTTQFVVYGVGWLLVVTLLREQRGAAALWGAYSLLQAAGMLLWATQGPGLHALTLSLLGYACASAGVDLFLHRRLRFARLWLLLFAAAWLPQLALAGGLLPAAWKGIAFNLGVALLVGVPQFLLFAPLQREFGRMGLLAQLPGTLFTLLVLLRVATQIAHPDSAPIAGAATMPGLQTLLPALLATGLFHFVFLGLLVARLVRQLRHVARHDSLTGLANRGAIEELLHSEWQRHGRHRSGLSVAFVDIDHFKRINDAGGHAAGDQALRGLAELLRRAARETDHVGRWGGEEFVMLLPHTDAVGALTALQRLQATIRSAGLAVPAGCPSMTVSIGVATAAPDEPGIEALIARADAAMYAAKQRGRDCVVGDLQ